MPGPLGTETNSPAIDRGTTTVAQTPQRAPAGMAHASSRQVEIFVTNHRVDWYEAKSYPDDQLDEAGTIPLYRVPVFDIQVIGRDSSGKREVGTFKAPRFMPYYNVGRLPQHRAYHLRGWAMSGLWEGKRYRVHKYKRGYEVHNRFSPYGGAIVVRDTFYIHAGPPALDDVGWGSAGCIEIVGNFDDFKRTIARFAGLSQADPEAAVSKLVHDRRLIVRIQASAVPKIAKEDITRRVPSE